MCNLCAIYAHRIIRTPYQRQRPASCRRDASSWGRGSCRENEARARGPVARLTREGGGRERRAVEEEEEEPHLVGPWGPRAATPVKPRVSSSRVLPVARRGGTNARRSKEAADRALQLGPKPRAGTWIPVIMGRPSRCASQPQPLRGLDEHFASPWPVSAGPYEHPSARTIPRL
jgi:hypothetical protein